MTPLDEQHLEAIGRIIIEIKLHKRRQAKSQTNTELSAHLARRLSAIDFALWRIITDQESTIPQI